MSKNTSLSSLINYVSANSSGNVTIAAPTSGLALDVSGAGRFTGQLTGTSATFSSFITAQSTGGSGLRIYGASGTNQWDIYLNSTNLRFSDNTGTGSVVFDRPISGTSATFSSSVTSSDAFISTDGTNTIRLQKAYFGGIDAIYQTGTNAFGIYLGGGAYTAAKLYITNGGNVGIGTTSPSATLHTEVNSSTWTAKIINTNTSTNNAGLLVKAGVNSGNEIILAQKANGTSVFLVDASGNVGIGTTSPGQLLTLGGAATVQMTLLSTSTTGGSEIYFGSPTSAYRGLVNYNHSSDYMAFHTAASERMRITSGGNVGIGTTSPQRLLDVRGAVNLGTTAASVSSTPSAYADIHLRTWDGANLSPSRITVLDNWIDYVATYTDGHRFRNWSSNGVLRDLMIITGSGNVGIGTASPSEKLEVSGNIQTTVSGGDAIVWAKNGTVNSYLVANTTGGSYGLVGTATNHDFLLRTYNTERMRITSGGNVGIGTTSPSNKLQVSGNIYSTDTVFARNLKPEAFAGVSAGTPSTNTIPMGYSMMTISTLCDGTWRPILTNINDTKAYFWASIGDAASKDTANYFMSMTSPAYGVRNFGVVSYQDNGWNTGSFEFTYDDSAGSHRLLVRATSYYSSSYTAYGNIYFLRLE